MNIIEAFNLLNINQESITIIDLKRAYKKASLKYHPDRNKAGTLIMKSINAAYEFLTKLGLDPIVSTAKPTDFYSFSDELSKVLNEIINLEGLTVEVCGNWIWVGGETKEHKEKLKDLNFKWAPKKKLWFFRPEEHKSKNRKNKTMEEIRQTYGSSSFKYKNKYITA